MNEPTVIDETTPLTPAEFAAVAQRLASAAAAAAGAQAFEISVPHIRDSHPTLTPNKERLTPIRNEETPAPPIPPRTPIQRLKHEDAVRLAIARKRWPKISARDALRVCLMRRDHQPIQRGLRGQRKELRDGTAND